MKNIPKKPMKRKKNVVKSEKDGLIKSDHSLESSFLLVKGGRLFIETSVKNEALILSFGRLWKPITGENKSITTLCGVSNPKDGLYKIIDKTIKHLLPAI